MVIDSKNIHPSVGYNNRTDSGASVKSAPGQNSLSPAANKPESPPAPQVSISSQGQALSRLESDIQESPSVDNDRVAAIKKALADGTYTINPERIAEKMLEQDVLFR